MKRIALVHSIDPTRGIHGIAAMRWVALGHRLLHLGCSVHLLTDRRHGERQLDGLVLQSTQEARWDQYDAVKLCHPATIDLVPTHPNLIARVGRVAGAPNPEEGDRRHAVRLRQQQRIADLAAIVAVDDDENAAHWQLRYGRRQQVVVTPAGCPERLPAPGDNPFPRDRRIALFCGSLTSPRHPAVLNALARRLRRVAPDVEVHFVGSDLVRHCHGESEPLDPAVVRVHGAVSEAEALGYMQHAHCGLALAPSQHAFESAQAKICYYLRAGLPVVTETTVANSHIVEHCAHGAVATYGDVDELAQCTLDAMALQRRSRAVMQYMIDRHGWTGRARIYLQALQERWACAIA